MSTDHDPTATTSPLDGFFDRWVSCGDSAALAALFDAAAPRLLAVGVHLVGEAARAEDLVQAVFLSLIERRGSVERGTNAEAWLMRVLRNRAIDLQRRRDVTATGRDGETPLEAVAAASLPVDVAAERRELEGSIAAAIDELRSPYREVLIARLRHGIPAAEIAHLLGRSPGQVRVQLHRGLELLRAHLPEREALAAVAILGPAVSGAISGSISGTSSGTAASLEAVREVVMASAASAAVPLSLSAPVWAFIPMFKVVSAVSVAALLLLAGYTVMGGNTDSVDGPPGLVVPGEVEPGLLAPGAALVEVAETVEPERSVVEAAPAETRQLTGRVIDAVTGLPIAGARVRCVRRSLRGPEWDEITLLEEFPSLLYQQMNGSLTPRSSSDWPLAVHIDRRVLAHPSDPKNEVLAEGVTDSDGRFSIDVSKSYWGRTLVEFEAPDYGVRLRPLPDLEGTEPDETPSFPELRLYRPNELRVQVVDENRKPLGAGIRIAASTCKASVPMALNARGFIDPESIEAIGSWTAATDDDGLAILDIDGERPHLSVLSPGWKGGMTVETLEPDSIVEVIVSRRTRLLFIDDETEEPIERVSVTLASHGGGTAYISGELLAPGGVIGLDTAGGYLERECPMTLTAWAPGYAAASRRIDHFLGTADIPLRLKRGTLPSLEGRVVRGVQAVAGMEVGLSVERLKYWYLDDLQREVVSTRTGSEGTFRLSAPPGVYVLRAKTGKGHGACFQVQLPSQEPLEIDLARLGAIRVEGQQHGAAPTSRCGVILDGSDGRRSRPPLDSEGRAEFLELPPGRYELIAVDWDQGGGKQVGSGQVVDLLPGQTAHLEFDLTPGIPGRCFIRCQGVEDYSGWRSRGSTAAWAPVSADGLLSQECSAASTWFQVEDGAGRRYQFYASSEDGLEQVTHLERGDCVYRGTLRDPEGEPASGIWITASPAEHTTDLVNVSAMTDGSGRFELAGLEARDYRLRFEDREERNGGWVKRWESLRFDPTSRPVPGSDGAPLNISLRTVVDGVPVHGVVVDANGQSAQAHVVARARYLERALEDGGVMTVGGSGRGMLSAPDGSFELLLPTGVLCEIRAYPDWFEPKVFALQEVTLDELATPPPLRIQLP